MYTYICLRRSSHQQLVGVADTGTPSSLVRQQRITMIDVHKKTQKTGVLILEKSVLTLVPLSRKVAHDKASWCLLSSDRKFQLS